jgi:ABC-type uncharacterized transport system permease subunit
MIRTLLGRSLAASVVLSSLLLVGCATGGTAPTASTAPSRAIVTTVHGMTTVYYVNASGAMEVMTPEGGVVCAECTTAAKTYFAGGKLEESCKTCAAKRQALGPAYTSTRKG